MPPRPEPGARRTHWTYERFIEHVLADDRAAVGRAFRTAIETEQNWNFECRIRRADGQVRWIWATGAVEAVLKQVAIRATGELARLMTEEAGLVIEVAADGAEAVALAERHPYDLILMDVQMPRLDGLEAPAAFGR